MSNPVYVYGFKPAAATPNDLYGEHVIDGIHRVLDSTNPHHWTVESTEASILPGTLYSGIVISNTLTNHKLSFYAGTRTSNKRTVFCQLHPEVPLGRTIRPSDGLMDDGNPNPYASPPCSIVGNNFESGTFGGLNGAGTTETAWSILNFAVSIAEYSHVIELHDAILILLRKHLTSGTANLHYGGCHAGKILVADNDSDSDIGIDGSGIITGVLIGGNSDRYAINYQRNTNNSYIATGLNRTSIIRIGSESWSTIATANQVNIYGTTPVIIVMDITTNVSSLSLGTSTPPSRFVPYEIRNRNSDYTGSQIGYLKYLRQTSAYVGQVGITSGVTKYDTDTIPYSLSWIHYNSLSPTNSFAISSNTIYPWNFDGPVNVDP